MHQARVIDPPSKNRSSTAAGFADGGVLVEPVPPRRTDTDAEELLRELLTLRQRDRRQRAELHRIHEELYSAARVRRDLQLSPVSVRGVQTFVIDEPLGPIGGDLYEMTRLDDSHVSIMVADAAGHGLAAGLLAAFVRRSLQVTIPSERARIRNSKFEARRSKKERGRSPFRTSDFDLRSFSEVSGSVLDPQEVLQRTNDDLLRADLAECLFVSAFQGVYDEDRRILHWARAGAPYPVLVRRGRSPVRLETRGPLLGVLESPLFEVGRIRLQPGDTVLLHTDGLDASRQQDTGNGQKATAPGEKETADLTAWFATHPIGECMARLQGELTEARRTGELRDDVIVVALHVEEQEQVAPSNKTCSAVRAG